MVTVSCASFEVQNCWRD